MPNVKSVSMTTLAALERGGNKQRGVCPPTALCLNCGHELAAKNTK
jgi:hypothetical protein